jgi:uncharacterized protein (DUF1499 family)
MATTSKNTETSAVTSGQKIRRWIYRLAWLLVIACPLFFAVAALGSKFGLWGWQTGLGKMTFNFGPKLLIGTLLVGFISLALRFLIKPRTGLLVSALAILVPASGLVYAKSVRTNASQLPVIHDITTDTQNPPAFTQAILSQRAKVPNVNSVEYTGKKDVKEKKLVSVLQTQAYPDIRTLVFEADTAKVFETAKNVASNMGWNIASDNQALGLIEATDTTFWYGFKDDVVIRVKPADGGGTIMDIRSVSRVGQSDLGANANRVRSFAKAVQRGVQK